MYCRKEMVKILKCYLISKKSYGTLSKGAIFFANPVYSIIRQAVKIFFIVEKHVSSNDTIKNKIGVTNKTPTLEFGLSK